MSALINNKTELYQERFSLKTSKVFRLCFGFALLRYAIGLKNSRHFFSQSEIKPKPIVTRPHSFSRALRLLHAFAENFDWFTRLSACFVIG